MQLAVRCDERAPGVAREALASISQARAIFGDAMLVVSELVTNAVRHSGASAEDLLEVCVRDKDGHLVISVTDPGRSGRVAQVVEEPDAGFGGLGLRLIEELTVRWGHERTGGYRVWAELPVDAGA